MNVRNWLSVVVVASLAIGCAESPQPPANKPQPAVKKEEKPSADAGATDEPGAAAKENASAPNAGTDGGPKLIAPGVNSPSGDEKSKPEGK